LVVAVATKSIVAAFGSVVFALVVHLAAIVEFHAGVSGCSVVLEGGLIAMTAVDMIYVAAAELLMVCGFVGNAAIGTLLSGHWISLEGMGFSVLMGQRGRFVGRSVASPCGGLLPANGSTTMR
tara:strand:- start:1009 stop:1377 length:369 start_codon:yes stop_codon:yes gene_type:complete